MSWWIRLSWRFVRLLKANGGSPVFAAFFWLAGIQRALRYQFPARKFQKPGMPPSLAARQQVS